MKRTSYVVLGILLLNSLAAAKTGLFFNVTSSNDSEKIDILLCLNGKGPLSCQKYQVFALDLLITTTLNYYYPIAGIKVLTPNYTINGGIYYPKTGYFLFAASNTKAATLNLISLKQNQTITFTSTVPVTPLVGDTYTVSATGGASGNPVLFSIAASSTAGTCVINGDVVTFKGPGTCIVDANQAGNGNYNAAPRSQQYIAVSQLFVIPQANLAPIDLYNVNSATGLISNLLTPETVYEGSGQGQSYNKLIFATVNGAQYAYITGSYMTTIGTVYQCLLNPDGSFNSCNSQSNVLPSGAAPYAIAITMLNGKQYAYITDPNSSSIYQCTLDSTGTFTSCITLNTPFYNVSAPYGIAITTINNIQYAYIADEGAAPKGVYQCQLDSRDGTFVSPCVFATANITTPSWNTYDIAFTLSGGKQYAYVADNGTTAGNGNVYLCTLNTDTGLFTSCNPTPSPIAPGWNPSIIVFAAFENVQYAYVVNNSAGLGIPFNIFRCIVTDDGPFKLNNCQGMQTDTASTFAPFGIAFRF